MNRSSGLANESYTQRSAELLATHMGRDVRPDDYCSLVEKVAIASKALHTMPGTGASPVPSDLERYFSTATTTETLAKKTAAPARPITQ
jgi:hypothetical protein